MTTASPRRMADTNLVVRYLTGTPPDQHRKAVALIESDDPLWLSVVSLLETAYVLIRHYRVPRATAVDVLMEFLRRRNVHVCELPRQRALAALALCRPSGRVSFGDALLWARGRGRSGAADVRPALPGSGNHPHGAVIAPVTRRSLTRRCPAA